MLLIRVISSLDQAHTSSKLENSTPHNTLVTLRRRDENFQISFILLPLAFNKFCELVKPTFNKLCELVNPSFNKLCELVNPTCNMLCELVNPTLNKLCQLVNPTFNKLCELVNPTFNNLLVMFYITHYQPEDWITAVMIIIFIP